MSTTTLIWITITDPIIIEAQLPTLTVTKGACMRTNRDVGRCTVVIDVWRSICYM